MSKPEAILFGPLPPPVGGVAVFMSRLKAPVLARGGTVWAYSGGTNDRDVIQIDHRRLGHIQRLISQGRNSRITDSTHFHIEHPHWLLAPLWLLLKPVRGITWIKVLHDGTLPDRSRRFGVLKRFLFQRAVRAVDEFVVVSKPLADWLRDDLHVKVPIRTIPALLPLGDDETAVTRLSDPAAVEVFANARGHAHLVCGVGTFAPEYGFLQMAEGVERARQSTGLDIALILIDGGLASAPDFHKSVVDNRDWIYTLTHVPFNEMQTIYKRSDAYIRGFAGEGYGLSRIEALWSGTPVIAAIATEERGMFSYRFDDVDALAAHVEAVLAGAHIDDADRWAAEFRADAERYLREHLESIFGKPIDRESVSNTGV